MGDYLYLACIAKTRELLRQAKTLLSI